jgi:ribosome-associated translation inhibitor RaiA
MNIEITTDHNIEGHESLATEVKGIVETSVDLFSDQITHVEVHLSDENSEKKGGNNKMRCVIVARIEGLQPVAVTDQASHLGQAVDGAADKLNRLLKSTLGRLHHQQNHRTDPPMLKQKHQAYQAHQEL